MEKSGEAFRTIGELAVELGVSQHVLRYWESRFPQLRPLQRAGNRRYYRPADIALAQRINRLLNHEGYTVRGVQKLLDDEGQGVQAPAPNAVTPGIETAAVVALADLRAVRAMLVHALAEEQGATA